MVLSAWKQNNSLYTVSSRIRGTLFITMLVPCQLIIKLMPQ